MNTNSTIDAGTEPAVSHGPSIEALITMTNDAPALVDLRKKKKGYRTRQRIRDSLRVVREIKNLHTLMPVLEILAEVSDELKVVLHMEQLRQEYGQTFVYEGTPGISKSQKNRILTYLEKKGLIHRVQEWHQFPIVTVSWNGEN